MLIECKKIVKWKNDGLHWTKFVRRNWRDSIIGSRALVVYFRGEYHFNYNHGP